MNQKELTHNNQIDHTRISPHNDTINSDQKKPKDSNGKDRKFYEDLPLLEKYTFFKTTYETDMERGIPKHSTLKNKGSNH